MSDVTRGVNLEACFAKFDDTYSPKIVGELNGQYVKLVRCDGDKIPWHTHEDEDELFLVLEGELDILERGSQVSLSAGEFHIVRRGTEHRIVPHGHVKLMLFEPVGLAHTGNVRADITRDRLDRLCPELPAGPEASGPSTTGVSTELREPAVARGARDDENAARTPDLNARFADRMARVGASAIREILKLTQRPEIISFAGGLPASETFPASDLAALTTEVLTDAPARALQYSPTEGYPPLREAIAARMNSVFGTAVPADEILVTSGSQQGLHLVGTLFLDEGDIVLCESPTYLGAVNSFRAFRAELVEVATDDSGMVIDELERRLAGRRPVKLIYVVPDFQNPSGRTWSLERRQGFMELVRRYRVPVVEDSPYAEVRFEGEAAPPLKALPGNEWVVYLGTFSKVFCPGMRIGWLSAVEEIYRRAVHVKQGVDLHTSTLGQMQLSAYLEKFDIGRNIQRTAGLYRERRDTMLRAMQTHFPPGVTWTRPQGGMFVWVTLPRQLDARDLLTKCLEREVAFVPGGPFFPNGGHENTLRMNFSSTPPERIEEGVRRMGEVLRAAIGG